MASPNMKGRDIVSIRDLSLEEITAILDRAEEMVTVEKGEKRLNVLEGKILATLFFEPSTRTRLSFESAMHKLGGDVLTVAEPTGSSLAKGETLADTIRMTEIYSDAIVIRHSSEGAARLAADFSSKPVINAGDGAGQHPTQTLLDLYTIRKEKGRIKGNNVAIVGDLKYGRTVHSLAYALGLFGAHIMFISPSNLQVPPEILRELKEAGVNATQAATLDDAVPFADVVYITRIQKERFPDPEEYRKVANIYRIDNNLLMKAKRDLIILHPLPRITEIAAEVDATPHAKYFEQARNGVIVRMAILAMLTDG